MRDEYPDGHGVTWREAFSWFRSINQKKRPRVHTVKSEAAKDAIRLMAQCTWCGRYAICDPHHICGGSRGRSDELCNLAPLCRRCHDEIQGRPSTLPRLLVGRWRLDATTTDWLRLTILRGSWWPFDELE